MTKTNTFRAATISLSLFWGSALSCFAQDSSHRGDFFQHNFAKSTGDLEGHAIHPMPLYPDEATATPTIAVEKKVSAAENKADFNEGPIGEGNEADATPTPDTEQKIPPIPVHSIAAIFSSASKEHLIACFKELTDVAIETDRLIDQVYTIGDMRNLDAARPYLLKMIGRNGQVQVSDELPKKYREVKMSPTYILKTEKGEIILEAAGPLIDNFNNKGEFVDKHSPSERFFTPVPTPSPTAEVLPEETPTP